MPFPTAKVKTCTTRLLLRPIAISDAPDIYLIRGDSETTRMMSNLERDAEHTATTIKSWLEAGRWSFAVELLPSERAKFANSNEASDHPPKVIGYIGLRPPAEIGYALNRAFWGNGYAAEAFKAFLEIAWENLDPEEFGRVFARTDTENVSSIKLLEKVGFHLTETVEKEFYSPHTGYRDTCFYRCDRPKS